MKRKALKTVFIDTLPVLTGYLFLGAGFLGVYFAFGAAADPVFTGVFLAMGLWLLLQLDTVTEEA